MRDQNAALLAEKMIGKYILEALAALEQAVYFLVGQETVLAREGQIVAVVGAQGDMALAVQRAAWLETLRQVPDIVDLPIH
ncbi:hypothetical protein KDH_31930 [Dictyobacter sp. S3.2.2.5]|uniref:Uncharacterized protein n=1 Tax=Dictyobacter halimunensis TaxID=3026934 RepID=A0ABQ6FQ11_9CHLR|nr:hypothetical protein KDH_31930 [Dictyobacter sp. S3.2.2.5]